METPTVLEELYLPGFLRNYKEVGYVSPTRHDLGMAMLA